MTIQYDIVCGNNVDVMQSLDNDCIDLTITSPLYDNMRSYNGYVFDFENTAKDLYRITKQGGVVVWVVGDTTVKGSETGTSFKQALFFKAIGFNLHDTMIYQKATCAFPDTNRYHQGFEYMFVFSKGAPKTFNPIKDRVNKSAGRTVSGTKRNADGTTSPQSCIGNEIKPFGARFNVWLISDGKRQSEHPAPFPEPLAEDHILSWSNEGDWVFDPFLGSGTTGKMALVNNRNFFGCDISQEYCDIAERRLASLYTEFS